MKTVFRELVAADLEAAGAEEVICKVGSMFREHGFVKESYIHAVLEREKKFPTGLQLKDIGIAMPHTDPEHVYKPGVCVVKLKNPVIFSHMAEPDKKVEAEIIFMLSVLDPNDQIDTLQKILGVIQNPVIVQEFKKVLDDDALYEVASRYIN